MMDRSAEFLNAVFLLERPRVVEWMDTLPTSFRSEAFAEDLIDVYPVAADAARAAPGRMAAAARLLAVTRRFFRPAPGL